VISPLSVAPWNPATTTIFPSATCLRTLTGLISTIWASPCFIVVMIPACWPLRNTASNPAFFRAPTTITPATISPHAMIMSSSRLSMDGHSCRARLRSVSVA